MSKSLRKILRLREMDKEVCRLKLATECQRLSELDAAFNANQVEKQDACLIVFREIAAGVLEDRPAAEGVLRLTELRIEKLKEQLKEQQSRVAIGRELYLESSIKATQLTRLLSDKEQVLKEDEVRRQQSALDDWFNSSKRHDAKSGTKRNAFRAESHSIRNQDNLKIV